MKRILTLLFLTVWPAMIMAQQIDKAIAIKYPPKISLKVGLVLEAVAVNKKAQNRLAAYFYKEENSISKAKSSGKSQQEILEIRQEYGKNLSKVLKQGEIDKYYSYYANKDTLTDLNTDTAAQKAYLNSKLKILGLDNAESQNLRKNLKITFELLCSKKQGLKLSAHLNTTMQNLIPYPKYFYALNKDKIDQIAWVYAVYYSNWYKKNHGLSKETTAKIFDAWQARAKNIALIKQALQKFPLEKSKKLKEIKETCDSLMAVYLNDGSNFYSGSSFLLAIHNAESLMLSEQQIKALEAGEAALLKTQKKGKSSERGDWALERDFYDKGLLNEDQLNKLLVLKNTPEAIKKGKEVWKALKEKKIAWESDSATVVNQVANYYITLFATKDFFINAAKEQKKHIKAVHDFKPEPLTRLENYGKKNKTAEPYRGTFLW